jgi:predicted naringenin-chalcone synthase
MHGDLFYFLFLFKVFSLSYLLCIETATPVFEHLQEKVAEFYAFTTTDEAVKRKINAVSKKSGIRKRFSVLEDFSQKPGEFKFFPNDSAQEAMPGVEARMAVYKKEALRLSCDAVNKISGFNKIKHRITNIITVTCTGLFAPGLDIELMEKLGLKPTTQRSSVNFMGCNAAVLALKQADLVCRNNKEALVLVVCTEVCTIHFQKEYSQDYILSNLLFGDGAAAMLVGPETEKISDTFRGAEIVSFHSLIIYEGCHDMAWQITDKGFIMNLTSYVSGLLNRNIESLLRSSGIHTEEVSGWAIHPGGKKILDDFCGVMQIEKEKLKESYGVLSSYGNMSSATILFVLKQMLESGEYLNGRIYAAAFGPGLSIESLLLDV